MNYFFLHFKKMDWVLITSAVLLVAFGLLSIYSSSLGKESFGNFNKQLIFFGIGIFLMFSLSFFDWRALKDNPYFVLIIYSVLLLALIGLFSSLAPEIRGTKSWYKIGPVLFDPIEFMKIVIIVILAKYFSSRHIELYRMRHIILSGVYAFLPCLLIFFQPNLGSALALMVLWIGILLVSGISVRNFLILMLVFLIIFGLSWQFALKDYQKARITSFIYPIDPLGVNWSQNQSKIAIGSGGILGQGIGKGSQTQYGFLTEPQTDFIFAAIAEEFGLAGISVLFFLFSILVWKIIKIAIFCQNNFSRIFAAGVAILLISEIFINIGMNIGILPIIGIPLPFISYGGSSLIVLFAALGIIQNIKTNL